MQFSIFKMALLIRLVKAVQRYQLENDIIEDYSFLPLLESEALLPFFGYDLGIANLVI